MSKVTLEYEIECIDKLIGLYFHAGILNQSTSMFGYEAEFRYYLKNGMGYSCEIDYGDGTLDTFNDAVIIANS